MKKSTKCSLRRNRIRASLYQLLALVLACSFAYAQSAFSLDLSSTQHTMQVPATVTKGIAVNIAGRSREITPASSITPAEFVAIQQILSSGHQTIHLNGLGAAVGGFVSLSGLANSGGNIVIPHGVSALANFTNSPSLAVVGDLTNAGNLYAYSTSALVNAGTISATSIVNEQRALISSLLPNRLASALHANLAPFDLTLVTGGTLTNHGLIQSSGSLNVQSQSAANDLHIDAAGGIFSAPNHTISIGNANFSGKANVGISGGNFISRALNVYSGQGTADLNVGQVTGTVNIYAGAAHVAAATPDLVLGTIQLSGDPTFYNTTGAVTLTLPLTIQGAGSGADLAVVAHTDITATGTGNIDVSSVTGNGGNILFIAGAQFNSTPTTTGQQNNDFGGSTLSITGASSTGGRIDLSGGAITNITSSSTAGNAGNITLVAFNGSSAPEIGAGTITLSNSTAIVATGAAGYSNGNVTIIAGANSATPTTAITTGPITTFAAGGATTGGNIVVATATPNLTSTLLLTNNASGSVTGSANPPITVGATQANASISTGALQAAVPGGGAGAVSVLAGANTRIAGSVSGSNINVGSSSSAAFTVLSSGSTSNGVVGTINAYSSAGSDGGSITLSNASGDIALGEGITSPGTNLALVAAGNIKTTGGTAIPIDTSSSSTNGGNVSMIAGAQLVSSVDSVQVNGAGAGGNIDLATAPGITSLNTFTSAASANGGNVSLLAFGGSAAGKIAIPSSVTVTSSGSGSGTNGSVMMVAGDTAAADTAIGGGFSITTSGGTGGNGNIMLAAATPNITCAGCASPLSSVTVTNGTLGLPTGIFGGGALQPASINIGSLNTDNSLNQVYSAGTITFTSGSSASGCVGCTLVGGSATSTVNNAPAGITVQTATDLTVPSALANANVANLMVQTMNNGNINIANNLNNSTSSTLIADGSGTVTTGSGISITSGTIVLASTSGDINTSLGGTPYLTTNTAGNATITSPGAITLNTSYVRGTFSLSAGGSIAMAAADSIITAGTISLVSTSGDINAHVGGTPNLTVNAPGSATITAAGDILLGASNVGSTFSVNSAGSITTVGTVTGGQIAFTSASNTNIYSSVTANNGITINATGGMTAATENSIVMSTTVGSDPNGIAVNPTGTLAYVANQMSNNVSIINLGNGTVIGTIPVGVRPWGITLDPSGKFAYVTNVNSDSVSVISTATNTVVGTILVGSSPLELALNPSGTKLYVGNASDGTVSVIDTSTRAVTATITVGQIPAGVGVNAAGTRVYVANTGSNTVSVIDTATNLVIATVPAGSQPQGMAINSAGTSVYVANNAGSSVSVIDASTNTLASTLSTGSTPYSVAINPAGTLLLVTNESGSVQAFNTATNALVATATTPSGNIKIAISPNGLLGWMTTFDGVSAVALPGTNGVLASSSPILLTSTNGNIGLSTAPINSNSTNLQFNSHGSAYLNSLSSLVVTGVAQNGINLVSAGAVAIGAAGMTNTHGSVIINTAGDISASVPGALAIISPTISLTATGGNIGGNIGATVPLLVSSGGTSGLTLFAKATQVSGSGGVINLGDTANEVVTLANGTQAGSTMTMSSANSFLVAGAVSAQGNITISASAPSQVSSPYPLSFDLTATTPSLTIPSNGPGLIVTSGNLTSTSGSISINGQTQSSSSLGSGSYDLADYSILISGGPTGTLTVTPSTLVTPAEWVAALQVQTLSSQPLTVGTNNAASGGSFTIASANVPSIGFNTVTVPASVTANISAASLFTRILINNGTIQASGAQTDLTLGNLGGPNQNFEVGGIGSFLASGGNVTFRTAGGASGILIIDTGTNFSVTGSLTMTAPTIKVGTTGSATAVITTDGSPITIQSVPAGSSSLSFLAGGTAATLTLNGGAVSTISNNGTNIGTNFSLVAGTSILMTDTAGGGIASASGGLIASPIISLVESMTNIGTSASAPLSIASSLSVPGTVSLLVNAKAFAWLTDTLPNDAVQFNNGTASSQASVAFSLNTSGNILASNAGNTAVTSPVISMNANGGNIAANPGATVPLLLTSGGIAGLNLFVNATKVSGTGGSINVSDTANETLTLANGTAAAGALTLTSGRSVVAAGTVSATGNIVITTLQPGQITANFPSDLNLTETMPTLQIPAASAQTLLVNSGAQVSSGVSISINGQIQASSTLGPGSYGVGPAYSVQIAGGPSGTLTITPSTFVTPAEWVAAVQVEYGGLQTLTVGTNNAASGGTFSMTPSNLPAGGFSTIVIPGGSGAVTAFLAAGSIQTNSLINNGTVQVSGTQTNLPITGVGTASGNLEIGGTGSFVAPSGTVTFQTASGISNTLTIDDATNFAVNGSLQLLSQNITVGSTGVASATLTTNGNPISVQPTSGTGALSFTAAGTASSLNLNGGAVTTSSSNGTNIGTSFSLVAGTSISMSDTGGSDITTSAGGLIVSPIVSLLSTGGSSSIGHGNLGTSALLPLFIASSTSVPGVVELVATSNQGSVWLQDPLTGDAVQFHNNVSGSTSVFGSFSLVSAGNIQSDSSSTAIVSPTISLTAVGGNIGGNATASIPLNLAGVGLNALRVLLVSDTVGGNGGNVNVIDTRNQALVIANTTGASRSSVSFVLNAAGSILVDADSMAITSPTISLTSTGGSILNGSTIPMLVSSGGTSGLSLFASAPFLLDTFTGGKVNLKDPNSETVTLNNSANPLYGWESFSLSAAGNIQPSTSGSTAITSQSISLTAIGGNIAANTAGTAPLLIASGNGFEQLYVNATQVNGSGGVVNIATAAASQVLVLNNATTPVNAAVSLTLAANGYIAGLTQGNLAITSPYISLTAVGANISGCCGGNPSIPLLVNSGGTSGLTLMANATQVSGLGGNVNISDTNSETVTLANGTHADNVLTLASGSGFIADGTVSAGGNINLSAVSKITSTLPSSLDLSATSPNLTIPAASGALIVDSGATVTSTSGTIAINGQSLTSPLGPGSYGGSPNYSITIAGGPLGSLTITPSTLVTPAEWVAAIQVQNTALQPLTIGANNAASGGSFSIDASNVPAGGFTAVVIPASTTANVSVSSIQTNVLINNGIFHCSNPSNMTITSAGTASGNLEIGGSGSFAPTSVYFETATGATNQLTIDSGTNLTIPDVTLVTPNIVVGNTGAAAATIASTHFAVCSSLTPSGSVSFSAGGTSANLNLNGGAVTVSAYSGISFGTNFVFSNDTYIDIRNLSTGNIIAAPGALIVSPKIQILTSDGNIGNSAASPLSVASNSSTPGSLKLTAIATGSAWLADPIIGDAVELNNSWNLSSASVLFHLVSHGNIVASLPNSLAVSSPDVSLTATGGNISADGAATTPLLINSGGTSGLTLYVTANTVLGKGGTLNIRDTNAEAVTLANGSSPSSASVAFTLAAAGSIMASTPGNIGITSPSISLNATGGNIAGNAAATSWLILSSGGTSGLNVFASSTQMGGNGGNINIGAGELLTIDNGTGPLFASASVTLTDGLGIVAKNSATTAIASPTISLTSSGASFGSSASQPLPIASGTLVPGTVTLFVDACGSAWLTDVLPGDAVKIDNSSTPSEALGGVGIFSLVTAGNIFASTPSNTAIVSQTISLVTTGGNIGGNAAATSPLVLVGNGGNGLELFIRATRANGTGGTANVADPMTLETVVLLNDSAPLTASVSFTLSANSHIVANSVLSTAIASPNISLISTRNNIGYFGGSPLLINSGGTSGLTLFANNSGGAVNIADTNNETVTLANATSPLGADWSFSLNATGSIMASSVGNPAIASPNIVLTATGGNIGGNASATSPLLVNSSGTVPNLTLFINATQGGGNGGTVNISETNAEDVVVSNSANPLHAAVAFTLSVNGNILPTIGSNIAITSPTISLTAAGGNIGGNAAATIPLLVNSGSTSGLNLYASATQVSGNGGAANITDNSGQVMTLANGTFASSSLQLTTDVSFIAAGTVSAGGNVVFTTFSSQKVMGLFPANLDLSQTTPTLTMPASMSTDFTVNAGGQVSSGSGSISINGHSQPNPVGPGTYSAPNYSITIAGGPTGTLTITPTTLVTPAEWVAAIQVQDSSAQPLNIGTNNAAFGGSFALTAANVPAGGFTNIVIPATTPGTTMTVSTPVQTNFLTNNGTIQGSVLQIFSNGNLSIGGAGTIQSTYGTTIQSGPSNDVNFTGGTLTFLGATEVFSGTGSLNQIFLQTGSGFMGANAVTLYSDKVAGDTSNISGNPLKIVPYSGTGTIANPNGDVVLPSNLIFAGKDLAILASGNIKAKSTVTSINLSALTGNGGSLIMVAGFDFQDTSVPTTTLDALFKTPNHDTWTITGPSASGGSVLLPRVAINTSSTANGNAGNITVIAHAGSSSAGTIQLGSITATANTKTGVGGSVTLIGQGGVQTGFIKTSGAIGNSVTIEAAAPALDAGSVEIVDGDRVGPGFTWLTPIVTDGGAILVSGLVNTAGSNGRGGDILMQADHQVQVKGTISATGLLTPNNLVGDAGGDIQTQSFLSSITISGSINTSALSLKTAVGTAAGNAGSMYINAESYISTGSLLAKGANNLGAGSGGTGGNILLTTNMITGTATPADGYRFGNVKVNGYITVQGGSVSATLGDMNSTGGNSGGVAVDAGTFIVASNTGGISINDRPGSGRQPSNNGTVGGVDIHTYGIQQLPARFDLTSTLDNIASLPGGMFTVGLTAPINGTQGSIAVDSLTVGSDNFTNKLSIGGGPLDGQITQNTMNGGATIRVHITGPASAFLFAPVVFPSGKRGILNPSQAVAEFQSDRGQTPITLLNQVASAGTIAVDQSDTNGTTFTAFKLPAGVTLSVTGIMPIFNMPASTLIKGTLNFATTGSVDYINLGTGALMIGSSGATLTPTATIDASNSTLILSGTASTWTNNANLIAGTLLLARPTTSALTFVTGLGASTQASQILLGPELDTSMSMTFKSNGAAQWNTGGATPQPIPVVFGSVGAPTAYQPNAAANGLNTALPLIKLTFALSEKSGNTLVPLTATVGGQIRGSSITISGAANTVVLSGVTHTVQTPLSIADGANLTSAGTLTVSTPAGITVGTSTQITAGTALYLNAGNVLALGNGNILTAGSLSSNATPYGTGVLLGSQIVKNGTIILSGSGSTGNNGVLIGNDNQLNEMGTKLNITAKLGNLQIGDSNLFLDRGGNVIVLAKGNISGGTANSFESQGVLNTATGGVEIGAGTTSSAIATAFSKPAGTRLGIGNIQGISDLFPTHGAIVLNPVSSTGVNMASGGTPNMSIDLGNGGVAVFDAQGNSTVQMQSGGIIQTQASKPVSLVLQVEPEREFVVDTDVDAI